MKRALSYIVTIVASVALSVPISTYYTAKHLASVPTITQPTQPAQTASFTPPVGSAGSEQISNIVQKYRNAVVQIDAYTRSNSNPMMNNPFFRQFFGNQGSQRQQQSEHALGTGFVFDKSGYILTNEHVIDQATNITVTFPDSKNKLTATVVGSDYDLDLAVLKVNLPTNTPVIPLGGSTSSPVGEWVIAVGNPLGFDSTVTVGVLSAKDRSITIENRNYHNLLQTDAAINPGNSGGPLLDLNGNVIGINTAVSQDSQGIGFAISIDEVKQVLNQLIHDGKIPHPFVGVYMEDITPDLANQYNLNVSQGALITQVTPGSPAAVAGLQEGDVIKEIDHQKMQTSKDVVDRIQTFKVGQNVTFLVQRNQKEVSVTVQLADHANFAN